MAFFEKKALEKMNKMIEEWERERNKETEIKREGEG